MTSVKTEGFLEHVMMKCEIMIKKKDTDVESVNKGMTKFMTNREDLNDLQDWLSDEQWVDIPHNTSMEPCKKVEPEEYHTSQVKSTKSGEIT